MYLLTPKQVATLKDLYKYIDENGFSPSFRDLVEMGGLKSVAAIQQRLRQLQEKGLVTSPEGQGRALQLTEKGEQWIKSRVTL